MEGLDTAIEAAWRVDKAMEYQRTVGKAIGQLWTADKVIDRLLGPREAASKFAVDQPLRCS